MNLRAIIAADTSGADRALHGQGCSVPIAALGAGSVIEGGHGLAAGRNVLLCVRDQLVGGMALVSLDGVAARIVVCPPGLALEHLRAIAATASIDLVISDVLDLAPGVPASLPREMPEPCSDVAPSCETEWLLLTSGTTGVPKLVSHSLAGLTGAIAPAAATTAAPPVWATFYDIRRYGGLQIFLRALLGSGSMVLPGADEPLAQVLARYGAQGVTHVSGTPSHWRRVLMNPAADTMRPGYVRLSGEIADQAILDALAARYPHARIGHAYASTEAGVGFEVTDGREGFAATLLEPGAAVTMKIEDDTLRIRSARTATRYVGAGGTLVDADGFVDTGDIVERRGERCYFAGRRGGIINIGGQKVHPEEIEGVINRHHAVRMSLVKSRRSPITGALVAADVMLAEDAADPDAIRREITEVCQSALASWKVPATIRFVPSLDVTSAGKLARQT